MTSTEHLIVYTKINFWMTKWISLPGHAVVCNTENDTNIYVLKFAEL